MKKYNKQISAIAGEIKVIGNNVIQCRELAKIAKCMARCNPSEAKFNGIGSAKFWSRKSFFCGAALITGILLYKVVIKKTDKGVQKDSQLSSGLVNELHSDEFHNGQTLCDKIDRIRKNPHQDVCVIGGIIRYSGVTYIVGATGEGKSVLTMQINICIALGECLQGFPMQEGNKTLPMVVIAYDVEQDDIDYKERYGKIRGKLPKNLIVFNGTFSDEICLLSHIKKQVDEQKSDVCISIDNLTAIIPGISSNRVRKFYNVLKCIKEEEKKRGIVVTVILVGHTNKKHSAQLELQDLSGSVNIPNFANNVLALNPYPKSDEIKILKFLKRRGEGKKEAYELKLVDNPYLHFVYLGTINAIEEPILRDINAANENEKQEILMFHTSNSWNKCFLRYKSVFKLKSRDDIRNAIRKWEKDKTSGA